MTSLILSIISILISIGIPLTNYLRNKFVVGAELTIELKLTAEKRVKSRWAEPKIGTKTAPMVIEYDYEIIIKNNSEQIAYYPKTYFNLDAGIAIIDGKMPNEYNAIPSLSKVVATITIEDTDITETEDLEFPYPRSVHKLEILLVYMNDKKAKFYTLYRHKNRSNYFYKRKQKGFNKTFNLSV